MNDDSTMRGEYSRDSLGQGVRGKYSRGNQEETPSDIEGCDMRRIEQLAREIASLSGQELEAFRRWFHEFDAAAWDAQIEADAAAGRLDELADDALNER
jgi:hypothetical protein